MKALDEDMGGLAEETLKTIPKQLVDYFLE
jgi:hypothetical protein